MHYLYFVAKKKEEGDKKEKIASEVNHQLESEGFASEGGFFSNSKADWFVMGGRWSGELAQIKLDGWHEKAREVAKKGRSEKEKGYDFITGEDIKRNEKELQELWEKLGGKGKHSWNRDQYYGVYEDDTMLLDKELYEALKKKEYNEVEVAIMDEGYIEDEMLLKDFLKKEKEVVGNYWICVVDYHN